MRPRHRPGGRFTSTSSRSRYKTDQSVRDTRRPALVPVCSWGIAAGSDPGSPCRWVAPRHGLAASLRAAGHPPHT
jgi:hypothetical protein